eukprot:jgi/Bigna1/79458/fgenesh1_pg.62_\
MVTFTANPGIVAVLLLHGWWTLLSSHEGDARRPEGLLQRAAFEQEYSGVLRRRMGCLSSMSKFRGGGGGLTKSAIDVDEKTERAEGRNPFDDLLPKNNEEAAKLLNDSNLFDKIDLITERIRQERMRKGPTKSGHHNDSSLADEFLSYAQQKGVLKDMKPQMGGNESVYQKYVRDYISREMSTFNQSLSEVIARVKKEEETQRKSLGNDADDEDGGGWGATLGSNQAKKGKESEYGWNHTFLPGDDVLYNSSKFGWTPARVITVHRTGDLHLDIRGRASPHSVKYAVDPKERKKARSRRAKLLEENLTRKKDHEDTRDDHSKDLMQQYSKWETLARLVESSSSEEEAAASGEGRGPMPIPLLDGYRAQCASCGMMVAPADFKTDVCENVRVGTFADARL